MTFAQRVIAAVTLNCPNNRGNLAQDVKPLTLIGPLFSKPPGPALRTSDLCIVIRAF